MADEQTPDAVLSTFACGVAGDYKWSGIAAVDRTLFCAPSIEDCVLVSHLALIYRVCCLLQRMFSGCAMPSCVYRLLSQLL